MEEFDQVMNDKSHRKKFLNERRSSIIQLQSNRNGNRNDNRNGNGHYGLPH